MKIRCLLSPFVIPMGLKKPTFLFKLVLCDKIHFNNIQNHWDIITKHKAPMFDLALTKEMYRNYIQNQFAKDNFIRFNHNTFSFLQLCSRWLNFIYFCKCLSCVPLWHKNIYFNLSIKKFVNLLKDYGRVIYKQIGVTERKKRENVSSRPLRRFDHVWEVTSSTWNWRLS